MIQPRPADSKSLLYLAAAVLVAVGVLAYANSFAGPFVFDDADAITGNESIRHWSTALLPPAGSTASGRPLLNLSLALNYAFGRYAVAGYHALNLAIHLGAGLLLFGIVRRTLRRPLLAPRFGAAATPLAFTVALLWTVHPLQTEAVTYVIQRAESLTGLFYLLTLYAFIRYAAPVGDGSSRAWGWLAVIACFCGMATKEVMVTAPLVVLLYDRTFLSRSFREALRRRRWVYAGVAASWVLLGLLVLGTGGNRGGTIGFGIGVAWWKYALTQFRAITTYVGLSVFPHPLNFDRGPFWVTGLGDVLPWAIPVLAAVAGTAVALRRWRPVAFLGCWFFLILSPTSSVVPGTTQMIVEHRLYLPLAAAIALLVLGAYRMGGPPVIIGGVLAAAALTVATAARNTVYRSELALWADVVAKDPANGFAQLNYGVALADAGELDTAIAHERLALQFSPGSVEAHTNLGNALLKEGRPDEALQEYGEALRVNPGYVQARTDYANALVALGRPADAVPQYRDAIAQQPRSVEAHNNLGLALLKTGRTDEAVAAFKAALQIEPSFAPAEFNLGNALRVAGDVSNAIAHYEAALRLDPTYTAAALNLGNLLLQQGDLDRAIAQFETALQSSPDSPDLHNSLGLALARKGRLPDAVDHYQTAVRLRPDYPAAQENLQRALHALGRQ